MKPVSLYFHVPFCLSRCNYCNFYSTTRLDRRGEYVKALCSAVASAPLDGYEAVTVYFGGGTPSLLGDGLITVLEEARRRLPVSREAEITFEANPCTVDAPLLERLRDAGFNRISIGLQDDSDRMLSTLGRRHDSAGGYSAVEAAKRAGFTNISCDIMLATPGQTTERAGELAADIAGLGIQHISAYLLKIEPGTPFERSGAAESCPTADEAADIYLAACGELEKRGWLHYEISNFSRPGFESRHNSVYWRLGEYLGIGPSAHSFFKGRRFRFPAELDGFIREQDKRRLIEDDGPGGGPEEYLMLSLRLSEGLDAAKYSALGGDAAALEKAVPPLEKAGLAERTAAGLRLTDRGFLVSNSVIAELLP